MDFNGLACSVEILEVVEALGFFCATKLYLLYSPLLALPYLWDSLECRLTVSGSGCFEISQSASLLQEYFAKRVLPTETKIKLFKFFHWSLYTL